MQQRTKQPETHRLILSISGVYASVERLLDYLSKKYRVYRFSYQSATFEEPASFSRCY